MVNLIKLLSRYNIASFLVAWKSKFPRSFDAGSRIILAKSKNNEHPLIVEITNMATGILLQQTKKQSEIDNFAGEKAQENRGGGKREE